MNEHEILNKLKRKLLENKNINEDMFDPVDMRETHPKKTNYYFKDYLNNVYNDGSKMLLDKDHSRSIRNSAVMIYNLLGNKVNYKNKYYDVEYEKKLSVIKNKDRKNSNQNKNNNSYDEQIKSAHLDFVLKSKDELIFGEAKMLEYLSSPKYLKVTYLDKNNYLNSSDTKFIDIFKKFIRKTNKDNLYLTSSGYKSKYYAYDAFQMLIHILGIYRYVRKNKNIKNVKLINVVWGDKSILRYNIEEKEAKDFVQEANQIFKDLFLEEGINFKIEYYNYFDFKKDIKFDDLNREKYLERYNIF